MTQPEPTPPAGYVRVPLAELVDPDDAEQRAGTQYRTCSTWALAKLDEHPTAPGGARLALLALAADADRGLYADEGYNGTTASRLVKLTGMRWYQTEKHGDLLAELELVEMALTPGDPEDAEVVYRLPSRFLPYMRD
jgi:hypothetical protein